MAPSAMSPSNSDTMSPPNETNGAGKRKTEDGAPQPRAKRNRYISIACNECKRRKIKCNGQTPCQRCGNFSLECNYAPNCCNNFKESEEFKQMSAHIGDLQQQVETLVANMNSLKHQVEMQGVGSIGTPFGSHDYSRAMSIGQSSIVPPSPARIPPRPPSKHPRFHGPTSSTFNLGVAKSSLKTMGITGAEDAEDEGIQTQDATPMGTPPPRNAALPRPVLHADKDPIWALTKADALRLVELWHEEMGIMYPILNIDKVLRHAERLMSFVEAASRAGLMQSNLPGADAIQDDQTNILKMMLAIALILEGNGKDPLGEKLFKSVLHVVDRALIDPVDLKSIHVLTIAAMYHFHRDDEALAWRVLGLAARQCFEMGLHRRETYASFTDPDEHSIAVRTFWSVYVLDRRWSFGTGLPFAMQESDIDQNLPKPDDSCPYLSAMITYSIIGSKVWKSVGNADANNTTINKEDMGFLDFQVLNWLRSIPDMLKFVHPDSHRQIEPPPRGLHRLQVLLYLRANQMRILIYRSVLHSATSIMENLDFAHTVVKVSKDTIRILTYVNQTSDMYQSQQTMFNYFLISALAVLFLAVAHAPAEFNNQARDEFYMALDLVRGLSTNSYVSKRLWKTIKMLKEVGPRLGLNLRNETSDAHSSAAVAMAGLAGHKVDELSVFTNGRGGSVDTPHGMASDLTSLFEAAGAFSVLSNGYELSGAEMPNGDYATAFGNENDDLATIMRDLF